MKLYFNNAKGTAECAETNEYQPTDAIEVFIRKKYGEIVFLKTLKCLNYKYSAIFSGKIMRRTDTAVDHLVEDNVTFEYYKPINNFKMKLGEFIQNETGSNTF